VTSSFGFFYLSSFTKLNFANCIFCKMGGDRFGLKAEIQNEKFCFSGSHASAD